MLTFPFLEMFVIAIILATIAVAVAINIKIDDYSN